MMIPYCVITAWLRVLSLTVVVRAGAQEELFHLRKMFNNIKRQFILPLIWQIFISAA